MSLGARSPCLHLKKIVEMIARFDDDTDMILPTY